MKTILAFETSTGFLSVALGNEKGKISEAFSKRPLRHSENLIPLLDKLLKKERLALSEIDAFAIDRGPGSFTGLRIGFSLLKGFLAVRKRPCYGALSLDMMTAKVRLAEGSRLAVVVDARRDLIYSRFYRARRREWVSERKLELLSLSQLSSRLSKETLLVGESLARYTSEIEVRPAFPCARTLVDWFHEKNPRLTRLEAPRDFVPLYFRASEAEERKRKK